MTRLAVFLALLGLASPASAQLVVVDPANIAKAVLIAERTLREYETLVDHLKVVTAMSQRLPAMERYRMIPIPGATHDIARFPYGATFLQALNAGDARGELYAQLVAALGPLPTLDLPEASRQAVRRQYATIEVLDSVAQRALHQRALVSGFAATQLAPAIQALQDDVTHPRTAYHYMTATLDKLAGGELIGRRQDTATNQLLSHALEQLLLRSKLERDTEAATMNLRLGSLTAAPSLVEGAATALRTWRQP